MKNIFWLFVRYMSSSLLRFLFLIFVVKVISTTEYGIVTSVNAWTAGLSSIFSFGVGTTIIRLSALYEKKDKRKIKGLIWFALKFGGVMSFVLGIILIVLHFLDVLPTIPGFLLYVFAGIFLSFPFGFLSNIIYGLQKMSLLVVVDGMFNSLRLILAIVFLYLGFGYAGVIYGLLLALFFTVITKFYVLRRFIGKGYADIKTITSHSISAYFTDLYYVASSQGRIILSNFLLDMSDVGIISLATGLSGYVGTIPGIIIAAAFPISSRGDNPKKIIKISMMLVLLFSIPILVIVALFARPIILILSKEAYLPIASYLIFFVIAEVLTSITAIILSQLYAVGRHKITRKIYAFSIPLVLLFNFFFIKTFGVIGVAFSHMSYTLIILVFASIALRNYLVRT